MIKKIMILFCIFTFLIIGISGAGFDPDIIGEFIEAGAELIGSGIIQFGEGEHAIGNLIGELEKTDISVSSVRVEKKEESNRITFLKDGNADIKGALFENVEALSYIEVDNEGNIKEAYLKVGEGGSSFIFDGEPYHIPEGGIIEYKDGEIIVKEVDSFEYGNKESNELTKVNLLGESIKVKNVGGNYIITGDSKIGNNEILGIGDNIGKATLSKNGEIIEIWGGTDATIGNIKHQTTERLKVYYDKDFNPLDHQNENYFNYGKDSISLGGSGFTTKLGEENNVFGDMETEKYIQGQKIPKTRNLEITLNGGNLEISKDKSKDYLAFDVDGDGDFVIDNGRTIIWGDYSERGLVEKDGRTVLSDQSKIFVKASEDKEGLLYSYDLNLNDKYILENNLFKDKKGNVLVNTNKPWEDVIRKGSELTYINEKEEKVLTKEAEDILNLIWDERGVRPRKYNLFADDQNDEDMVKWAYEAAKIANNNAYGIKVSPEEVFAVFMLEGGSREGLQEAYRYDHYAYIPSEAVGLDNIGDPSEIAKLKAGNFIPANFEIGETYPWMNERNEETTAAEFNNPLDAYIALAGEYAYRKKNSLDRYKKDYGEDASKKLTKVQEILLTYYSYNCGEGCLQNALGNVEENIFKNWERKDEGVNDPRLNSMRLLASIEFLQETGLFRFL